MRLLLLASAVYAVISTQASACEEFVRIDRAQTVEFMKIIRDDAVDPLEQLYAFETLICSDQSGVRDLTLRTGAKSQNPTIRGQVLLRALMEKEVIDVELLEVEGLTKEQYERIKSRPMEMLGVKYRDISLGCLSFHYKKECLPNSVMSIMGTTAAINVRYNSYNVDGVFGLSEDGSLRGRLSLDNVTYPARIALF